MSDILEKIVAVKHEELIAAKKRAPLEAVRFDAESRVLTRDFTAALRAKIWAASSLPLSEIFSHCAVRSDIKSSLFSVCGLSALLRSSVIAACRSLCARTRCDAGD